MTSKFLQAAESGAWSVVKKLISAGADIHDGDDYVMVLAAGHNNIDMMKWLEDKGCTPFSSPEKIHQVLLASLQRNAIESFKYSAKKVREENPSVSSSIKKQIHSIVEHAAIYENLKAVKLIVETFNLSVLSKWNLIRVSNENIKEEIKKYINSTLSEEDKKEWKVIENAYAK